MPISNPILQGLTITQGVDVTLATVDPTLPPTGTKKIWLNSATRNLFISIGTASIEDWIALKASGDWEEITSKPNIFPSEWEQVEGKPNTFPSKWDAIANKPDLTPDVASILNKIVVQDGQVLTTDENVIFED